MMNATNPTRLPALIAHRGYASRYPENTLVSIRAAIEAGAKFVEVDVQISADRIPVLHHDASVKRMTGVDKIVMDSSLMQLKKLDVYGEDRSSASTTITTLRELTRFLRQHTDVTAFVEIKSESCDRFGLANVVDRVIDELQERTEQFVIISFEQKALRHVREHADGMRIGWVLDELSIAYQDQAQQLSPNYLFCDNELLPAPPAFWPGNWQWAVYEIDNAPLAVHLGHCGAHFVETMAIGELMECAKLEG